MACMSEIERRFIDDTVRAMAELLLHLTPEQRVDILDRLTEGWCRACGDLRSPRQACPCENDE